MLIYSVCRHADIQANTGNMQDLQCGITGLYAVIYTTGTMIYTFLSLIYSDQSSGPADIQIHEIYTDIHG